MQYFKNLIRSHAQFRHSDYERILLELFEFQIKSDFPVFANYMSCKERKEKKEDISIASNSQAS